MTYTPVSEISDEVLILSDATIPALLEILNEEGKFDGLPGMDSEDDAQRLNAVLDTALQRLIGGIAEHPRKRWVFEQLQPALAAVQSRDTVTREHLGTYAERVMDVLGIESSDGLLSYYLGGI
jgi:hypothetical protein